MHLSILCLVCLKLHYVRKDAEFDKTHAFCQIFNSNIQYQAIPTIMCTQK